MKHFFLQIFTTIALPLLIFAQPAGETIDKIVAIVGDKIIMLSDVETQYWQLIMQGEKPTDELKCNVLEELLLQKMLLTQAENDSLVVSDSQVEGEIDRRLRYFIQQLGSPEALEKYYNKTIPEIKDEFKDLIKNQLLVQQMQNKITENVSISPAEVERYFKKLSPDSIPFVESEMEIGQIVFIGEPSAADKQVVYQKISDLRNRILKGENFEALARLYSEDPGSAKNGGELGMFSRGQMYPEFEGAAFLLKNPGDVSEVVESPAGYHVLQLISRRGDYINVRHILLMVKTSPTDLYAGKLKLDTIYNQIVSGKITFANAADKYNPDGYKNSGGILINPYSGSTKFKSAEIDASIFFTIDKLEPGSISKPVLFQTEDGKEGYRILYLKSRSVPHKATLTEDYNLITRYALEAKKRQALDKWIASKKNATYVKIFDDFAGCIFKYKWD